MQYHPEVVHSERGMNTLRRFLTAIAGLTGDWSMESVIEAEKKAIADKVGPDAHVICALSGGVDSTVAATLVHQVRTLSLQRHLRPLWQRVLPCGCHACSPGAWTALRTVPACIRRLNG